MHTKIATFPSLLLLAALALTIIVGAQTTQGATHLPALPISGAGWVFVAPYGWNRVQATTLGLGVWLHPGDKGYTQNISARADQSSGTLPELAKTMVARIKSQHPDAEIAGIQKATVCGGHPAVYLTWAATVKSEPLISEQMLTLYGNTAYAATYTRAATQASIHAARSSLTTLCGGHPPPGEAAQAPAGTRTPTPTPSGPTSVSTPQPQQTYGYPVATITPRFGP